MKARVRIDVKWQNIEGLLLALTPFFRNYRIPVININLATSFFLVMIFVDFFNYICLKRRDASDISKSVVLPVFICMTVYLLLEYYLIDVLKIGNYATAGNFLALVLYLFEIWGLLFVFSNSLLRKMFKKHIIRITLVMCFVIFIQYFLYYLFDITLTRSFFVPFSGWYEPSVTEYLNNSSMVIDGLFRPSAFFLEPSHFAAYSMLALGILIFDNEEKIDRKAVFITVSILLTTSGLGMAASLLLWAMKGFRMLGSKNRKKMLNAMVFFFAALIASVVLYFTVDIFQNAVNRVLINDDQNAITGRLWTSTFLNQLSGVDKCWGVGFRNRPISEYTGSAYYMTGSVEMLYCQGIIGTVILGVTILVATYRMWKKKEILNFSIIVIFIIWFIMGNILTPYYLVKYLPFTYPEDESTVAEKGKRIRCQYGFQNSAVLGRNCKDA